MFVVPLASFRRLIVTILPTSEYEREQQEEDTHDTFVLDEEEPRAAWRLAPPSRRVLLLALVCLIALLLGMTYAFFMWLLLPP